MTSMLDQKDPSILPSCQKLLALLKAHGVSQWAEDKVKVPGQGFPLFIFVNSATSPEYSLRRISRAT